MNFNKAKLLVETEHKLISPELIGTDAEKIACLRYWSEIVGLFRSLNVTVVSFDNKVNIIAAIKAELELVDMELHNVTAAPDIKPGEIPSMEMVPPTDPAASGEVDLSKPEPTPPVKFDIHKAAFSAQDMQRMRRNAGVI